MIEALVADLETADADTGEGGESDGIVLIGKVVDADSLEVGFWKKGPEEEESYRVRGEYRGGDK